MGLGFGAVTTKSITRGPRPGHPQPNLVRVEAADGPGLVNCKGFKNPGLEAYRRALAGLPHRAPLIVAAAGESVEEYVEVVAGLEEFGDLVEINISSPNTRRVYEPRLSQKVGGLSGPALFAVTLDSVRRLRDRFGSGLEIIACGGIDAPAKACRALSAGANACAYFTGFVTRGPILARLILDALLDARK